MSDKADETPYITRQVVNTTVCVTCAGGTFDRFGLYRGSVYVTEKGVIMGPYCRKCNSERLLGEIMRPRGGDAG